MLSLAPLNFRRTGLHRRQGYIRKIYIYSIQDTWIVCSPTLLDWISSHCIIKAVLSYNPAKSFGGPKIPLSRTQRLQLAISSHFNDLDSQVITSYWKHICQKLVTDKETFLNRNDYHQHIAAIQSHVECKESTLKTFWLPGLEKYNCWGGTRLSQGLVSPNVLSKSNSWPIKLKLGEMLDFFILTMS